MNFFSRAFSAAAITTALVLPRVSAQSPATSPAPVAAPPAPIVLPVTDKAEPPARPKTGGNKLPAKPAPKKIPTLPLPKPDAVTTPENAVARQANVNLRGQATLNSEAISKLKKGEPVTVLELIELKKPRQDEPTYWYKIALPATVPVWVHSSYVDTATGMVKGSRLNLRGGPGENYSIVGRLGKGATVKVIETRGQWLKIEPPASSYGFVASHLLERGAAAVAVAPKTNEVAVPKTNEVAVVTPATPVVPPPITETTPTNATSVPVAPPVTDTNVVAAVTNAVAVPPSAPETLPSIPIETVKKVVSREGVVKGSISIQAPSYYELRSLETGRAIAYLHSSSTNLNIKDFKGLRIIATGEEVLDERWQHTPVLVVDTIQTLP